MHEVPGVTFERGVILSHTQKLNKQDLIGGISNYPESNEWLVLFNIEEVSETRNYPNKIVLKYKFSKNCSSP